MNAFPCTDPSVLAIIDNSILAGFAPLTIIDVPFTFDLSLSAALALDQDASVGLGNGTVPEVHTAIAFRFLGFMPPSARFWSFGMVLDL